METTILALETSCDESAVAILSCRDGRTDLRSSLISSQIELHRAYGGVVPEVASRNHALRLRPLVEEALSEAEIRLPEVAAVAATRGPGLASSLLVGHSMAKALAVAADRPFYSINHMEGHLLSPFLETSERVAERIPEHLALIVSGGHTMLVHATGLGAYSILGRTIDDAAGEAFDKVARLLGLPYPGGPEIEKMAKGGDPKAFSFPRSMPQGLDFSFSGLKTSVRYTLPKLPSIAQVLPDLCASFQQAVIDVLVSKSIRACQEIGSSLLTLSGGVSCNGALREALAAACAKAGLEFLACPPRFSTDNAAMIGFVGLLQHHAGRPVSDFGEDIDPNLALGPGAP